VATLTEQMEKLKASINHLRAEAEQLREAGEDLEDAEMLRAAGRLETQARRSERTLVLAERTEKMIAERKAGVRS
jgi:prefoldin subunit 5